MTGTGAQQKWMINMRILEEEGTGLIVANPVPQPSLICLRSQENLYYKKLLKQHHHLQHQQQQERQQLQHQQQQERQQQRHHLRQKQKQHLNQLLSRSSEVNKAEIEPGSN